MYTYMEYKAAEVITAVVTRIELFFNIPVTFIFLQLFCN